MRGFINLGSTLGMRLSGRCGVPPPALATADPGPSAVGSQGHSTQDPRQIQEATGWV